MIILSTCLLPGRQRHPLLEGFKKSIQDADLAFAAASSAAGPAAVEVAALDQRQLKWKHVKSCQEDFENGQYPQTMYLP